MTAAPSDPVHPTDPAALGALAVAVAREAGALLLDAFAGTREVDAKTSPTDVVTEMDRAAEEVIVRRILEARPDDGILGEEGAARESRTAVRWVIDPLDGTVNYLYRRPDFAVSIGVEMDGVAVAGAVFAPARDECFAAVAGRGATLNGQPIHPSTETRLAHALCGTGFGYETEVRRVQGAILERVISEVRDIRRAGSAALDLCAVACGRLDVYYERGLQPWDGAAAALIVREAGGRCETVEEGVESVRQTWIAANRQLFPAFRALIATASGLDAPPRC